MCFWADTDLTRKLQAKTRRIKGYKFLDKDFKSTVFSEQWYEGMNYAHCKEGKYINAGKSYYRGAYMEAGLYMYRNPALLNRGAGTHMVVEVWVRPEDVLGASNETLCVVQCEVKKGEFDRARARYSAQREKYGWDCVCYGEE